MSIITNLMAHSYVLAAYIVQTINREKQKLEIYRKYGTINHENIYQEKKRVENNRFKV